MSVFSRCVHLQVSPASAAGDTVTQLSPTALTSTGLIDTNRALGLEDNWPGRTRVKSMDK